MSHLGRYGSFPVCRLYISEIPPLHIPYRCAPTNAQAYLFRVPQLLAKRRRHAWLNHGPPNRVRTFALDSLHSIFIPLLILFLKYKMFFFAFIRREEK